MKRPLSLKNRCFIGVAACHRILGRDRGGIVLRGERRKGGIGFVIDHRRRRCAAAMTSAAATAIMASVDIVVCQVWTNESLRAPNEVAAGRERRPHRRQSTPWSKPHSGTLAGSTIDSSCSWSGTTGSPGKCCSYERRSDPPERRGDPPERRGDR